MFDYIHFEKYITKHTITNLELDEGFFLSNLSDEKDTSMQQYNFQFSPFSNTKFCLEGNFYYKFPIPVTPGEIENYFYVQGFILVNATEHYYTERVICDSYMILYTYEGEGALEYEGKTYKLHNGDCVLIDCNQPHVYKTFKNSWKFSALHFQGHLSPIFYKEFTKNGFVVVNESMLSNYQNYLEQLLILLNQVVPCRGIQISNIINNILTHLIVSSQAVTNPLTAVSENIQYLVKYIENHYVEDLTLEFLASFSGISKYYLSREFHKFTGFPPREYIIQLRINRAKFLLTNTNYPSNKVAVCVGIPNEHHFIRLFKQRVGMTPGAFRKQTIL